MKHLELAINKFYINFEKKLFLLLSSAMIIMCTLLCMQYFSFVTEVKKMNLVKQEYYNSLDMLKKIIQEKNCDISTDDLDVIEDKVQEIKNDEFQSDVEIVSVDTIPVDTIVDIPADIRDEEDVLDEQDEDTQKFQFVSDADEKQLKDLRKQARQVLLSRKKTKQKSNKSLGVKQIAQLKKKNSQDVISDYKFHWPLELHHFWLSSLFGARKKANGKPGFHYGIDLAAMKGTPIKAAASGTVIQAQYVPGYGNNILIQHNKYYRTRYAHLNRMNIAVGQKVLQGKKIGEVGDSGSVRKSGRDASHLHFEIYHNGSHVNPLRYLFN